MFESLEGRLCMSATLTLQVATSPPPPQTTITAIGESPEQAARAAASQGTLSRGITQAVWNLLIQGLK